MNYPKDSFFNWMLFMLLCMVWGSSFILMKAGMYRLSPYQVATIRIMSAGIILVPFARAAWRAIPRNKITTVLLSGLLGSFFPAYLFCLAETQLDSSLAGILNALTPFFVVLTGMVFFGLKANAVKITGLVTGFAGLYILSASNGVSFHHISYALYILVATAMYGINVNVVGKYLREIGSINIAALAFVALIIPCLVILALTGYFSLPLQNSDVLLSTLAACVLGIMGTAIASILFYMLVKRSGTLFASMVTYGIPFIAVLWGVWYGEIITLFQLAGLGIILAGVYLVNRK